MPRRLSQPAQSATVPAKQLLICSNIDCSIVACILPGYVGGTSEQNGKPKTGTTFEGVPLTQGVSRNIGVVITKKKKKIKTGNI